MLYRRDGSKSIPIFFMAKYSPYCGCLCVPFETTDSKADVATTEGECCSVSFSANSCPMSVNRKSDNSFFVKMSLFLGFCFKYTSNFVIVFFLEFVYKVKNIRLQRITEKNDNYCNNVTSKSCFNVILEKIYSRLLYTLHSTLYTLHFLLPLHFTLYTLHSTLYTLRSTLSTAFTLYTLHSTLYTLHFTLYTFYCLYTLHSKLYTLHSTLSTAFTLYTLHFTLYTLHFTLYTFYCLYTLNYKLYTLLYKMWNL